jgi:hypothetical protein
VAIIWTLVALVALVRTLIPLHLDSSPTAEAAADNLRQLRAFWISSAAVWIGLTVMWVTLRRRSRDAPSGRRQFWKAASMILAVALGARGAILMLHEPALSHDVYRYIFDGRNLAAGYNPYLVLPADRVRASRERWPGEHELVPRLAFPELATPYLSVSLAVFGAIGLTISPQGSNPMASARVFRMGFVMIEFAMMLTLIAMLRRAGRSAWWAALYAWHPLPIAELAGSGHQEVIGIACLVASLAAFTSAPGKTWRWTVWLALSALGKPITLPAGPIMLRGRPRREWLVSAVVGGAVIGACIAPLWLIWGDQGRAYQAWHATATDLGKRFTHFAGVYEAILAAVRHTIPAGAAVLGFNLPPEWVARNVCLAIFLAVTIGIFFSRLNAWQAASAMLFALVLLTTAAHPWYLLWAFALFPMADSWAVWVLSLTLPWGYAAWAEPVHRTVPHWVLAVAYVPVLLALVWDVIRHSARQGPECGVG